LTAKIRQTLRGAQGQSVRQVIAERNPILHGWVAYFRRTEEKGVLEELDGWTRRKVRAVLWRHGKRGYARAQNLKRAGLTAGCARLTRVPAATVGGRREKSRLLRDPVRKPRAGGLDGLQNFQSSKKCWFESAAIVKSQGTDEAPRILSLGNPPTQSVQDGTSATRILLRYKNLSRALSPVSVSLGFQSMQSGAN